MTVRPVLQPHGGPGTGAEWAKVGKEWAKRSTATSGGMLMIGRSSPPYTQLQGPGAHRAEGDVVILRPCEVGGHHGRSGERISQTKNPGASTEEAAYYTYTFAEGVDKKVTLAVPATGKRHTGMCSKG